MKSLTLISLLLGAGAGAPYFSVWSPDGHGHGYGSLPRPARRVVLRRSRYPVHPTSSQVRGFFFPAPAPNPMRVASRAPAVIPQSTRSIFRQAVSLPAPTQSAEFLAGFSRKSNNLLDRDIVQQTRSSAEYAKTLLASFKTSPAYAPLVVRALQSSNCLDNIDDAIAAVEMSTKLVEEIAPTFQALEGETDLVVLTRATASMLRQLESLSPRLAASPLNKECRALDSGEFGQLLDLHQFSSFLPAGGAQLGPGVNFPALITQTQTFLARVKQATARLQDDELCARGNFQAEVTNIVEEIFTDLTSLLRSVGGAGRAREADGLQQRLRGMFRQVNSGLNTAGFTLPCGAFSSADAGSYTSLAATLEDLAVIMEEVGVETLAQELGLDLEFNLNSIEFNLQ